MGITQKVDITEAKRLGKEGKKDGDDRPRLLKFECESLEQVQLFSNNSRKLMNSRSMNDVYIGNDWTKKQQGEQRILRVALHEGREESDRNRDGKTWRIKGSKIIESGQDADVHLVPEVAGGAAAKKVTTDVNTVNIINTFAFSVERLSTVLFNVRSIVNKLDEFEVFVHNEEPYIIGVSETWLHADISYSESELKGYCMYRGDRMHMRGGGCLLYINETIKTKAVVIE